MASASVTEAAEVHGVISLEIEGFFEQIGIEPDRIFKAEVDHLVAQRTSGQ